MPDNATPNPADLNPAGGGAPANSPGTPPPAAQPSAYNDLATKKGFKSQDDFAKSYGDLEVDRSKRVTAFDTAKKQVEQQSNGQLTIDDSGNVVSAVSGQPYTPSAQPGGQPPSAEVFYDPYTGVQITDPIALQLIKLPPGQREAVIFNALSDQRDKQQTASYQNDVDVLSKPEAKGFEDDVRKVMMALPLGQKAKKEEWENALLRVKGMRYDKDKQVWAEHGVNEFINKDLNQQPPAIPGAGGEVKLTPEQEQTYNWYQQNQPGLFKDKTHFAKALIPTGGR